MSGGVCVCRAVFVIVEHCSGVPCDVRDVGQCSVSPDGVRDLSIRLGIYASGLPVLGVVEKNGTICSVVRV